MTKKYTLTTSEETVTENPNDIIRLMKLAGLENAQPVAEELEAEVYEPTEANDKLDLDDYSKKSPESIAKQKKSIQPTLGDNPLEYSLDENEIYDAMMKEFPEDKVEEITEKQSPAQKAAFEKMLAAKNGKKDDTVEEKEETTEEKVEETTVEENLEKAQEEIDELKEELITEDCDCDCGHGSDCDCDCDCGSDCDCGCNSVNEDQDRIRELAGIEASQINEDESLYDAWDDMCLNVDEDKGISVVFDMKNMPDKRFHVTTSDSGEAGNPGHDHVFVSIDSGMSDHDGDDHLELEDVKNNMTGAALTAQVDGKVKILKTIGSFKNWDDVLPPEPRDPDLWKYPDEHLVDSVNETNTENNMEQDRMAHLAGIERESQINEDESVWNQFRKLHDKMDDEGEEALFFSMKHWPKHRFELAGDIDGKDTKNGEVHLGIFVSRKDGDDDNFAGNMTMPQDEIKANITGAAWVGTPGGGFSDDLKGLAGDYTEHDDIYPEPYDDKEPEDQHRRIHAFSKDASGEYHNKDDDQERLKDLINYQN